jgi:hypothetical protein
LDHDNAPSHTSFSPGVFDQQQLTVVHNPSYFSLFPLFKMKPKDRHFDTIEVMEAELQSVLNNALTEHKFQDEF